MSTSKGFLKLAAGLTVVVAMGIVERASARNRAESGSSTISVTLRVYDYVHMDRPILLAAEGETSAILGQAGLGAHWVDCATSRAELASFPECQSGSGAYDFVLRMLPKAMADSQVKGQDALGIAYETEGPSAYLASIFYDRVSNLVQGGCATLPVLLGRAMAHEIGHLLLGAHSHSNSGIMLPFWSGQELRLDARPCLLFTPEQSRQIRTRLAERAQAWQAQPNVAGMRPR